MVIRDWVGEELWFNLKLSHTSNCGSERQDVFNAYVDGVFVWFLLCRNNWSEQDIIVCFMLCVCAHYRQNPEWLRNVGGLRNSICSAALFLLFIILRMNYRFPLGLFLNGRECLQAIFILLFYSWTLPWNNQRIFMLCCHKTTTLSQHWIRMIWFRVSSKKDFFGRLVPHFTSKVIEDSSLFSCNLSRKPIPSYWVPQLSVRIKRKVFLTRCSIDFFRTLFVQLLIKCLFSILPETI